MTDLARLDNIQYRAGKIVTGVFHFTNKQKLNAELGWENITQRGDLLSLSFFHKVHLHETRPLIRNCMPKVNLEALPQTRSKIGYISSKYRGAYFEKFNQEICKISNLKSRENLSLQNINIFRKDQY